METLRNLKQSHLDRTVIAYQIFTLLNPLARKVIENSVLYNNFSDADELEWAFHTVDKIREEVLDIVPGNISKNDKGIILPFIITAYGSRYLCRIAFTYKDHRFQKNRELEKMQGALKNAYLKLDFLSQFYVKGDGHSQENLSEKAKESIAKLSEQSINRKSLWLNSPQVIRRILRNIETCGYSEKYPVTVAAILAKDLGGSSNLYAQIVADLVKGNLIEKNLNLPIPVLTESGEEYLEKLSYQDCEEIPG